MNFVGVDACRKGWFSVALDRQGNWKIGKVFNPTSFLLHRSELSPQTHPEIIRVSQWRLYISTSKNRRYMNFVVSKYNYAIDWFHILTMLIGFLFHCRCFFDRDNWHIKISQGDAILKLILLIFVLKVKLEITNGSKIKRRLI